VLREAPPLRGTNKACISAAPVTSCSAVGHDNLAQLEQRQVYNHWIFKGKNPCLSKLKLIQPSRKFTLIT